VEEEPEVTTRVFFDVAVCEPAPRGERVLGGGNQLASCPSTPLGRFVIGLYGKVVPFSVDAFTSLVKSKAYKNTLFTRLSAGEYVQAGTPGLARLGLVEAPPQQSRNPDTVNPGSFRLHHSRPGVVSLALSVDDGEDISPLAPLTRFRIITGPGPVPRLDGKDIVMGRVLQGLDTVNAISRVPTYAPTSTGKLYNGIAKSLGDKRAATARGSWTRPRQAIVIVDCGLDASAAEL
jgi:peptidyl-prolyl cis-trans isomerase B (cyclophilin B)